MKDLVVALLVVIGGLFSLLAAVGVVRMPDLFTRMHASSKAGTLGSVCLFLAVAVHFTSLAETTKALLVVAFLFLTAPVAAHLIGRAAYFVGTPMWPANARDDLRGRYDPETHALRGDRPPARGGRREGQ